MVTAPDRRVVLLGPQRQRQRVAKAVAELGVSGPLAAVTAGWEEREHEDEEMSRDLGGRTRNLALYPRVHDLYAADDSVRSLVHERQDRLRELQALYRMRLAPQAQACRTLLHLTDPADPDLLHGPEIESAIAGVRALDEHHLGRAAALEAEIVERLAIHERPAIARHRAELAEIIEHTEALLIAGGNVETLLTLMRLFDVTALLGDRPVVAWSGGAMVVSERVVAFHDSPPQGPGDAEIYGPGLGLVTGVVPLPYAQHRLQLDDPARVALLARRFAPAKCVTLDYGGRIDEGDSVGTWNASGGAAVLGEDGRVSESADGLPAGVLELDDVAKPRFANAKSVVSKLGSAARRGTLDEQLAKLTFPVIGDGWALYVFRGNADEVLLHHWVSGLPSAQPFRRLPDTDVWVLETEIQHRARIEYKFEVVRGPERELIRDPLNETLAHDPFGANSVVQGLGYQKPFWTEPEPTARRGEVFEMSLASDSFGHERPYSVYLPARFRETKRYPLLVVHDGIDYVNYADLVTVLDNLIHRLEIPPLVAALIQSPDRLTEYVGDERHVRFVADELVPTLEAAFPLLDGPSDRGLLGASLGAVASLHTAWTRPDAFSRLLLQSGSFAFTDIGDHDLGPVMDPVVEFVNRFREEPRQPAERIFLSAGIYESLIYFNRSLLPVFQSTGADVRLVEAQDGHNWQNWRDQLREGLTWLFPGPLTVVYE